MGAVPEPLELHHFSDPATGLEAIVALDNLTLGPAFGGCRFRAYGDLTAAREDACLLAAGMTLKNALAGIPFGGGKAVIRRPEGAFHRAALFAAFGQAIDSLQGRYVTAMDSGTETADMDAIATRTRFVSGSSGQEGDPSPFTARGLAHGIRAAVACELQRDLAGVHVAIQGVGHVGAALAEHLAAEGARLTVADVDSRQAKAVADATGARAVHPAEVLATPCDLLAPCAFGGVLDDSVLPTLDCRIIAGAANNQLAHPDMAERLAARGILYVPDFVINSGGVIHAALAWQGESATAIGQRVDRIGATVADILERARSTGTLPETTAVDLARSLLEA
ncbi:MAG: Glu/Leu/Phe/Val dehydrogenase [Gammaproteobacteria bacterium]|nr:Glu/Leu/Phe/Val dehydrogenase [Gammaproteobacteria bacterium]